jgi:hypothetical protein
MPFITKGYGAILAVNVSEFEEGVYRSRRLSMIVPFEWEDLFFLLLHGGGGRHRWISMKVIWPGGSGLHRDYC